tara:strand:- start:1337 stop:1660 length:324 start_codon:yes stop_codon:yes gene_type:complete
MKLYHNPRCSKSRQALQILEERNIDFEIIKYLEQGIDKNDLDILCNLSGIIRTNEPEFKNNNIDTSNPDSIKSLLIRFPKLLQRPILIKEDKAVIGRPPEQITTLLP